MKIKNSMFTQKLVQSWTVKLRKAKWKYKARFDSSLQQSIWLCSQAMRSNTAAVLLNPTAAKSLEKKGIAKFQDIWDKRNQCWSLNHLDGSAFKPTEKLLLSQVMDEICEDWPTSTMATLEPAFKHWELKDDNRETEEQAHWITKAANAWQKEGCYLTEIACRKKLREAWRNTKSGRLNLLMWRVISRKIPVRAVTSRWGNNSHLCPRCHAEKETLKHALWGCKGVLPLWKSCSAILEGLGVTEAIQWKQALLGCKGRMNPAFYKI